MAIADINAAGGIKSMSGAQLEALLGDSQTKPEIGAAEVEKMKTIIKIRKECYGALCEMLMSYFVLGSVLVAAAAQ